MQTPQTDYSFAIFPFLKTRDRVSIGGFTFRSTDDTDGLSTEQAAYISEIASMLFLQDNLRIRSASYTIVPYINMDYPSDSVEDLMNLQAVVAYCYASPRHEFGDIFLSSEHASMAIFTPSQVLLGLVNPEFHVDAIEPQIDWEADHRGEIKGYTGLYNFKHAFWAAKGSRLYGPNPHMILNHSQDLGSDLSQMRTARADYRLLNELLRKPSSQRCSHIFTAVRWFNAANSESNDHAVAILNLAIAFESLLSLPAEQKTDRLTDAISLLLGRTPRLDIWARQFYDARSRVVHEGCAQQLRFVATDSRKAGEGPLYQSLISYGRKVFQLCLGTLLVGAELAENAGLEDTLVTNQERFKKICMVLSDETIPTSEGFEHIAPIVAATQQYKYVPEGDLKIETMIGAVRLAARGLIGQNNALPQELKEQFERLINAKRTKNHLYELEALLDLDNYLHDKPMPAESIGNQIVRDIVEVVGHYVFLHYYKLKKHTGEMAQCKDDQAAQDT